MVSWLEDQRCNLHYIDQPIYFPSWLPSLDYRMRHEVLNLQSIYLLKMYRNPFTHFLIAGEAHSADVVPFLQSRLWPFWLPRMRHEVPNWRPRCAILPSITLLIAEDEARSAESGLAILFSCSFSHIFLNLSAFPTSFLPITWWPGCAKFILSFPIYNSAHLGHQNFACF